MSKLPRKKIDRDNPDWSATDFRKAVFLDGIAISDAVKAVRKGRGPQRAPKKIAVSIRLRQEVIEHFKAQGKGWQSRMEGALMKAAKIKEHA